MSLTFVFFRSLVLTLVVGLFLLASGKAARRPRAQAAFWTTAALVHLVWWFLPDLEGVWSQAGRWLVTIWVGALVTAVLLIVPFALFLAGRWLLGRRAAAGTQARGPRVQLVYVGLLLATGIAVSFGTVGGPVVREEVVQVSGLPEGLDGLRIANIGDVHVGPFIKPADLAAAVDLVNARKVDLLAITGDLIDDLDQLEPTLDALERSEALPVLSILGNHDKYPNEAAVVAALKRRNPRILRAKTGLISARYAFATLANELSLARLRSSSASRLRCLTCCRSWAGWIPCFTKARAFSRAARASARLT